MSLECSECERDLRGGHDPSCSRIQEIAHKRTTRRQPSRTAAIQYKNGYAVNLSQLAQSVLNQAQQKAFNQGLSDFENSTRDHPPYGFSDLQQAWKLGWLAGKQKSEGLNAHTLQRQGAALASSQRKAGIGR